LKASRISGALGRKRKTCRAGLGLGIRERVGAQTGVKWSVIESQQGGEVRFGLGSYQEEKYTWDVCGTAIHAVLSKKERTSKKGQGRNRQMGGGKPSDPDKAILLREGLRWGKKSVLRGNFAGKGGKRRKVPW